LCYNDIGYAQAEAGQPEQNPEDVNMSGFAVFGFITVLITICVVAFCLIAYAVIMRKRHYCCPHCGATFKVPPLRSFFASGRGVDKLLTCPCCGAVDHMDFRHDSIEEEEGDNS